MGHYAHDLSPLTAKAGTNAAAKIQRGAAHGDTGVGASNAHEHESRA